MYTLYANKFWTGTYQKKTSKRQETKIKKFFTLVGHFALGHFRDQTEQNWTYVNIFGYAKIQIHFFFACFSSCNFCSNFQTL